MHNATMVTYNFDVHSYSLSILSTINKTTKEKRKRNSGNEKGS